MCWKTKAIQRPAPGAREQLASLHIDRIHIGPLLTIHFDIDEMFVHISRNCFIFKRFAFHHMTPMTGAVANADQYRFLFRTSSLECLWFPGIPVHGIVSVLEKVGRGLVLEEIHILNRKM